MKCNQLSLTFPTRVDSSVDKLLRHKVAFENKELQQHGEYYGYVHSSSNKKTGKIPVTIGSRSTCPQSCPFLKNGCYADSGGPLFLYWRKISEGTHVRSYDELLWCIQSLPNKQLWRHNQAGDLAGTGDYIDPKKAYQLVEANREKRGFTYTHKPVISTKNISHEIIQNNIQLVTYMNRHGFTVNISANGLHHLDMLYDAYISEFAPLTTVLSFEFGEDLQHKSLWCKTPQGRKVYICPAFKYPHMTCKSCGLCQKYPRGYAIGFPAHGNGRKKASRVTEN